MFRTVFLALPILLAGCGPSHHIYSGPQRSEGLLAKVECYRLGTDVRILAVDGQAAPDNFVLLLPGKHLLTLAGPTHITAKELEVDELAADRDEIRPEVELELDCAAGRHYFIGASYKELAFLRVRSDQSRVWEEGFYASWTLELSERGQTEITPPILREQILFEAE